MTVREGRLKKSLLYPRALGRGVADEPLETEEQSTKCVADT